MDNSYANNGIAWPHWNMHIASMETKVIQLKLLQQEMLQLTEINDSMMLDTATTVLFAGTS